MSAEQVLVRDVSTGEPDRSVTLLDHPDDTWLRLYHQRLPLDMATPSSTASWHSAATWVWRSHVQR